MLQVYHSIGIIGTVTCRSSNGRLNLEVPAGWECNFRMLPTACNDLLHVFLKLAFGSNYSMFRLSALVLVTRLETITLSPMSLPHL